MTRKRFVKLLMGLWGMSRNEANSIANIIRLGVHRCSSEDIRNGLHTIRKFEGR